MTEQDIREAVEQRVAENKIANRINADRGETNLLPEEYNAVLNALVKEAVMTDEERLEKAVAAHFTSSQR
jgi:hypothetical protein